MLQFRVRTLICLAGQKAHKGHAKPYVAPGTTIYAVEHIESGTFFYYAYIDRRKAEIVASKFEPGPVSLEANFRMTYKSIADPDL